LIGASRFGGPVQTPSATVYDGPNGGFAHVTPVGAVSPSMNVPPYCPQAWYWNVLRVYGGTLAEHWPPLVPNWQQA
jgi:hypothetical protein